MAKKAYFPGKRPKTRFLVKNGQNGHFWGFRSPLGIPGAPVPKGRGEVPEGGPGVSPVRERSEAARPRGLLSRSTPDRVVYMLSLGAAQLNHNS